MTLSLMQKESMEQYKNEERSLLAKRASSEYDRLTALLNCMKKDKLSTPAKIKELKKELFSLTKDIRFRRSKNMGDIVSSALDFVKRNYENVNPYIIR